jgi:hypothetical protein
MTRTQYTMLFAVVGAAIAFWTRRNSFAQPATTHADTGRGELIFTNHVVAE